MNDRRRLRGIKKEIVETLWERQNKKCYYCRCITSLPVSSSRPFLVMATLEHIRPLGKGGTNDIGNLVMACWACNQLMNGNFNIPKNKEKTSRQTQGLFIDERWEYYVPDEEVLEALPHLNYYRETSVYVLTSVYGLRVVSNADWCSTKLAFDNTTYRNRPRNKVCIVCKRLYTPGMFRTTNRQTTCSYDCEDHHREGRIHELIKCSVCGVMFRPNRINQRSCSKACFSKICSQRQSNRKMKIDEDVFKTEWLAGTPSKELSSKYSVRNITLHRWAKRFNLPPRKRTIGVP